MIREAGGGYRFRVLTRDFVRSVPLFSSLSDADATALSALGKEQVFKKGQTVFRAGEPGGKLFLVLTGVVEITQPGPGGRNPVPIARIERGEILGELGAFDGGPRSATATAALVPETHLAAFDVEDFHAFLGQRPQVAAEVLGKLLRTVSGRLRRTSEALQVFVRALRE